MLSIYVIFDIHAVLVQWYVLLTVYFLNFVHFTMISKILVLVAVNLESKECKELINYVW